MKDHTAVLYKEKKECCGCGACAEACRAGAISMKEDKEGFPYPSLNQALCIGCGRCQAVCPIQSKDKKTERIQKWGKEKLHK